MVSLNKLLKESKLFQFQMSLGTAEEVYEAAVYGAVHKETQLLQILEKLGLKSSGQTLTQDKYKDAVVALNAISENEKKIELNFKNREVNTIRSAIKIQLKIAKDIPKLAREQIVITYATLLEGFVNDVIKNYLKEFPQSLKSNKATLKDNQLVDAIIEGNALDKLVEARTRELMYDSISGWIKYLNDKGLKITESKNLKEMFLVRNVIIHNNKIVGQELEKEIGGRRYQIGKK